AVSYKTGALARNTRAAVQKIGKLGNAAIRDEGPRVVVRAQRRRSRNGRASDHAGPEVQASQHVVEQSGIAAAARRIERIEKAVLEYIHPIERHTSRVLCAFSPYIGYEE